MLVEARALGRPWLEVYTRHWRLQAANADDRGAVALSEATATFEFAHRDETARCPQSVCVVQDLCITYGNTDGPGFADARIAVALETLDRIDPSWSCWSCLSTELVRALLDAERLDDAAAALDARRAAVFESGLVPSLSLDLTQVMILIRRGRADDALTMIDDLASRAHPGWDPERKAARLALLRCETLAALGRGDEARACLPSPETVKRRALGRSRWIATIERLVELGSLDNDDTIATWVHDVVDHARAGGAWRRMFDTAAAQARLALARGSAGDALDALAALREARGELRVDAGAAATLAELESQVSALADRGA